VSRIDLIARQSKFKVAREYDHNGLIRWESFQKIVQIKPDVTIGITGIGNLKPNIERAIKYTKDLNSVMYVILPKQRQYQKFEKEIEWGLYKSI
jgi:hypothetical protein